MKKSADFRRCLVMVLGVLMLQAPIVEGQDEETQRKGPNQRDIQQYSKLTLEQKAAFRSFIEKIMRDNPEMSREDRGKLIRAELQAIADGGDSGEPSGKFETLRLWSGDMPGPAPQVDGEERDITAADGKLVAGKPVIRLGHVSTPEIEVYLPPASLTNGSAVVVCPGGGFHILAQDLEGTEVAEWLNVRGVTAIVLKYRVPTAVHGNDLAAGKGNPEFLIPKKSLGPVMDAQRALALTRANAEKWNLDPDRIGVMGFSAGGQTAALAAIAAGKSLYEPTDEMDEASCAANFAMLIYSGGLADEKTGALHEFAKPNEQTPPVFLIHAADDRVTCLSSVALFGELKLAGVPSEMHIFETGGHGYGLRPTDDEVTKWPELARRWMQQRGVFGDLR